MNYFLDTEFHEYFKNGRAGLKKISITTIDLISIGIVSDDNREYYAINKECNLDDIWKDDWLRNNVLFPIYSNRIHGDLRNRFQFNKWVMKMIFDEAGKTKGQIAREVREFVLPLEYFVDAIKKVDSTCLCYADGSHVVTGLGEYHTLDGCIYIVKNNKNVANHFDYPRFYAYYGDYDWVVFCQNLFGRMMNLPELFPMYCRDLKQMYDELEESMRTPDGSIVYSPSGSECGATLKSLRKASWYPKQSNEHIAIEDAKWNRELYHFIDDIKTTHINK